MQHTHHAISQAPFHTTTEQRKRAHHSSGTYTQVMARRNGSDTCTMPSPYRPLPEPSQPQNPEEKLRTYIYHTPIPAPIPHPHPPLTLKSEPQPPPPTPPSFAQRVITLSLPSIHPLPRRPKGTCPARPLFPKSNPTPPPPTQKPASKPPVRSPAMSFLLVFRKDVRPLLDRDVLRFRSGLALGRGSAVPVERGWRMRWAGSCLLGYTWLSGGGGLAATNVFCTNDRNPGERLPHTEEQSSAPTTIPFARRWKGVGVESTLLWIDIPKVQIPSPFASCCNPALSSSLN